jgi:type IV secretory pathway VirJ component
MMRDRKTGMRPRRCALIILALTLTVAAGASAEGAFHLIVIPAASGKAMPQMMVLLSGDGGWGTTDKGITSSMAARGMPAVGINSLRYFWVKRTPREASKELDGILKQYQAAWKKKKAVLVGYSFGADVLPFMISRLPEDTRSSIRLVVLLGPSATADFVIHVKNMFGGNAPSDDSRPVAPEIEKLKGMDILCIYGAGDKTSVCPRLDKGLAKVVRIDGGHAVGANVEPVVKAVLKELE